MLNDFLSEHWKLMTLFWFLVWTVLLCLNWTLSLISSLNFRFVQRPVETLHQRIINKCGNNTSKAPKCTKQQFEWNVNFTKQLYNYIPLRWKWTFKVAYNLTNPTFISIYLWNPGISSCACILNVRHIEQIHFMILIHPV